MQETEIIVITPVKDGGWILKQFLDATSMWADKIVIALDGCTDNSREICIKYSKVILLEVNSTQNLKKDIQHRENRRNILLEYVRNRCKSAVIVALDVDEIFTTEILQPNILAKIRNLTCGNALSVNFRELWFTPLMYRSESNSNWSGRKMPCIWRDDGTDYQQSDWHEERCPISKSELLDINLLHYARVVPIIYFSRMRHYIIRDTIENGKNPWIINYIYANIRSERGMKLSAVPKEWNSAYLKKHNDFFHYPDTIDNYYNQEIIKIIKENYQNNTIYKCDIWDVDWSTIANDLGLDLPKLNLSRIKKYQKINRKIQT